jgi:hypothetical protein
VLPRHIDTAGGDCWEAFMFCQSHKHSTKPAL